MTTKNDKQAKSSTDKLSDDDTLLILSAAAAAGATLLLNKRVRRVGKVRHSASWTGLSVSPRSIPCN